MGRSLMLALSFVREPHITGRGTMRKCAELFELRTRNHALRGSLWFPWSPANEAIINGGPKGSRQSNDRTELTYGFPGCIFTGGDDSAGYDSNNLGGANEGVCFSAAQRLSSSSLGTDRSVSRSCLCFGTAESGLQPMQVGTVRTESATANYLLLPSQGCGIARALVRAGGQQTRKPMHPLMKIPSGCISLPLNRTNRPSTAMFSCLPNRAEKP